jgi:sensor histidine kinase YesM
MITSINERDQAIFDGQIKHQQLINHQQKMEMEILSSKINPHFLYNDMSVKRS